MNVFNAYGQHDAAHMADLGYQRDMGGPSEEGRKSQFYSAADLEGRPVPDRQWLVHNMIPMNTVTLFSGDGGTGKSLLALQLAVSAATGKSWLNEGVEKKRALFLSAEDDDDELHIRLASICRTMGLRFADLDRLTIRSLAGEDALLAVEFEDCADANRAVR